MDKNSKKINRAELKEKLMIAAAARWTESVNRGFKTRSAGVTKSVSVERQSNHFLRENIRSELGLRDMFNQLTRIEEAQINTWDAENRPPHAKADLAGRPVARLVDTEQEEGPLKGFGTGFLVGENLLMTNYHVFPDIDYAIDCQANFNYEYLADQSLNPGTFFKLAPELFFLNNRELDFAIVAIETTSVDGRRRLSDLGFVKLIETSGKVVKGDDMNIIQYPLGNQKQYACRQNQVTEIFEEPGFIQYITDTARASSGSPCFNKYWELAALHHCAIPQVLNGQIIDIHDKPWDRRDEDTIRWVANEGISISRIIQHLKTNLATVDVQIRGRLTALLGEVGDPLLQGTGKRTESAALVNQTNLASQKSSPMPTFQFNFYEPTNVYINGAIDSPLPEATGITPLLGKPDTPLVEEGSAIVFDEDYDSRETLGYKEEFLPNYKITLPTVHAERLEEMYMDGSKPYVAKYYNYSLAMNKKRRFCMWTAVNVNYDPAVRTKKSRDDFGRDTWRRDPRFPDAVQVIGKELYNPAKRVEQGHIVRRDDACWAWERDEDYIIYANSDTFHYTNCTPQLEPFNRENPRAKEGYVDIHGIWGALEEHIKKQLKNVDNLAVIFAAPHLSTTDPQVEYQPGKKIKTPMKFWKIVCITDEHGQLQTYGFWLDQKDVWDEFGPGLEEGLDFSKFKKQQIRIGEITKRTKIEFDQQLYASDVLKNNNIGESAEGVIGYTDVSQIQVLPKTI